MTISKYCRWCGWAGLSLFAFACGGSDAEPGPDGPNEDGGGPRSDSGATSPDGGTTTRDGAAPTEGENGWSLIWSDEFDGDTLDTSKWDHEINCWGGGNNEQQCDVADAKNSFVRNGALHIVALKDNPRAPVGGPSNDPNVVTMPFSSARLITKGKADFKYGRMEARLTLPHGQGLWPAFWMLPTDIVYGEWAASGEIDIMEAVNSGPGNNKVYGTLHYGGQWPANVHTGGDVTPSSNVWEQAHVYAVEWQEGEIRWFVDDKHYATQTKWNSSSAPFPAPFNEKFHILLNVAVGGAWPGPPNGATSFPQEMVVDYVRVFQCATDPARGIGCGTSDPTVKPL